MERRIARAVRHGPVQLQAARAAMRGVGRCGCGCGWC